MKWIYCFTFRIIVWLVQPIVLLTNTTILYECCHKTRSWTTVRIISFPWWNQLHVTGVVAKLNVQVWFREFENVRDIRTVCSSWHSVVVVLFSCSCVAGARLPSAAGLHRALPGRWEPCSGDCTITRAAEAAWEKAIVSVIKRRLLFVMRFRVRNAPCPTPHWFFFKENNHKTISVRMFANPRNLLGELSSRLNILVPGLGHGWRSGCGIHYGGEFKALLLSGIPVHRTM